jgi:hypothetical protein
MAEYFGGTLAGVEVRGWSGGPRASWAALVGRLSSFDVYLHYLVSFLAGPELLIIYPGRRMFRAGLGVYLRQRFGA